MCKIRMIKPYRAVGRLKYVMYWYRMQNTEATHFLKQISEYLLGNKQINLETSNVMASSVTQIKC